MLIQCQSCRAKYRLNLEKIPNRKTFIRCRQCTAPIYIDPQNDLPEGGDNLAAPSAGGADGRETVELGCDNCGARYRVAAEPLKKVGLRLKCSSCGHKFAVPEQYSRAAESPPAPAMVPSPNGATTVAEGVGQLAEKSMPVPGDARVDSMFDDLQMRAPLAEAGPGHFTPADGKGMYGGPAPSGGAGENPEAAFLEAVSLGEPAGTATEPPTQGKIPDDQKYRFFMKPKDPSQSELDPGEEPETQGGTDLPDLPDPGDLPPLDDGPPAPAPTAGEPGLPPLGGSAPAPAEPQSGQVMTLEERAKNPHGPNPPVDGQPEIQRIESRLFWTGVAIVSVLLVAGGVWGYSIFTRPSDTGEFAIVAGQLAELSPTLTRKGYFVTNQPSGERLFVLTGELLNQFETTDAVGWIRIEGIAYDGANRPLQKAHSYAGNMLQDSELRSWELPAIAAYHGYLNGRSDSNFRIPKGKSIPYQIVLRGVGATVAGAKAQITSFSRQGVGVYLKTFP